MAQVLIQHYSGHDHEMLSVKLEFGKNLQLFQSR